MHSQIKISGGADLDKELEASIVQVYDELNESEIKTFEVLIFLVTKP